jgi:hypothetical protein
MYIDIKKNAIVSCTGHGFKHLEIESDSTSISLISAASIVYFNQKNTYACIRLNDSVVCNYLLKLKPNKEYIITSRVCGDQGPKKISFKTDQSGNIISASDSSCNH